MKLMNKKGQVGNLQGFILSIISVAVILAIGLTVLGSLGSNMRVDSGIECNAVNNTACNAQYNTTTAIVSQMAGIPTWIGIIITVSLAFIVLGYFFMKRG